MRMRGLKGMMGASIIGASGSGRADDGVTVG